MPDKPLDQEQDLARGEEETAYMGFVSQGGLAGRVRKLLVSKFAGVLHRRNPMISVWEPTTLFEEISTSAPRDGDFSEVYNLDFKSGNSGNRHNFTEDYAFFEIFAMDPGSQEPTPVTPGSLGLFSSYRLVNSSASDPLIIYAYQSGLSNYASSNLAIYKESGTSFRMGQGGQNEALNGYSDTTLYLCRIVGWKMTVRPTTL